MKQKKKAGGRDGGKGKGKGFETDELTEEDEIEALKVRIEEEAPERGSQPRSDGKLRFDELPLSSKTMKALKEAKFEVTTDIQAAAISHSLVGRDILGAAKTGSGKTLAFIIPCIEKLYLESWSPEDGLGALIITPTRELALQIFEVLRVVGKKHQFSAGLITGGKKQFEEEQERVVGMNILVATPGRLLQHFEQSIGFDASSLQILVLDEADRILDMGFRDQLDNILTYLPARQTLLYSATQTKSIKDLARLNLNKPEYVAVHAQDQEVTPKLLVQNYIVCKLHEKLDIIFSFVKSHLKSKTIIFFSTCSQARFVHECFRAMQPGVSITALHGKIKQERRTIIYMDFVRKSAACMIATDVAARGLDFPQVDWVVQADAPEDTSMYVHRVGRTARNNTEGRALLLLTPPEEKIVADEIKSAGVPLKKLNVNPKMTVSVATKAAAMLVAQPDLRSLAKKAFTAYLRSLQLMPGKVAIDINKLDCDQFAQSLGLPMTPPIPLLAKKKQVETGEGEGVGEGGEGVDAAREEVRQKKNVNRSLDKLKKQIKEAKEEKKLARDLKKGKVTVAAAKAGSSDDDDSDDELLRPKTAGEEEEEYSSPEPDILDKKKAKKLKINKDGELREAGSNNKKTTFDEEGNVMAKVDPFAVNLGAGAGAGVAEGGKKGKAMDSRIAAYTEKMKEHVDAGRRGDTEREKGRIKQKHQQERQVKKKGDEDEEGDEEEEGEGGGWPSCRRLWWRRRRVRVAVRAAVTAAALALITVIVIVTVIMIVIMIVIVVVATIVTQGVKLRVLRRG